MSYVINKFNGEQLIVLDDGTIDTSTSINLVGRNYVGYGEAQNENFLWLLENFANNKPPARPLTGQLWFDTSANLVKVYNLEEWVPVGSAILSQDAPTTTIAGSFWLDTNANQLKVYTGSEWQLIGPEAVRGFGSTKVRATTLDDTVGNQRPVLIFETDDVPFAICTASAFTINPYAAIDGFETNLTAGINLSSASKINGNVTGNAGTADALKTSRNINGVPFNGTSNVTIKSSTTRSLISGSYIVGNDFDGAQETTWSVDASSTNAIGKIVARNSEGGFSAGTITATFVGNLTGNVTATSGTSRFNIIEANSFVGATLSGNAATATQLANARKINGVNFDGTSDITIPAPAGILTGNTLASNVLMSSLTSVGTLTGLSVADLGITIGSSSQFNLFVDDSVPTIRSETGALNFDLGPTGPDIKLVDTLTSLSLGGPNSPALIGDNITNLGIPSYKFNNVYANNFKGNADTATLSLRATNIVGGGAGALVIQSDQDTTTTLGLGPDGFVLRARPGGPQWEPSIGIEPITAGNHITMINTATSGSLSLYDSSLPVTIGIDATPNNVPLTVASRDVYGNIAANSFVGGLLGNVIGNVSGNAGTVSNGVYTTGTYSNPSWITTLAGSKVTSIPNSSLQNPSITINGYTVSLGGAVNIALAGIPSGGIIMWNGLVVSIPSGWALCNGSNGTPDLRDRFIVGAGSTYAVGATGGSKDAIVVSHSHSASVNDPGHSHSNVTQYGNPITRMGSGTGRQAGTSPDSALGKSDNGSNTDNASTGISVSISSTGSSGTNANLPPYYALCFIMKL